MVALVAFGIVGLTASGVLPLVTAALLGVLILVATQSITPNEARHAVDLDVVVTIAAAFGLAAAIVASGLGAAIADQLFDVAAPSGQRAILAMIVLLTVVLKAIITNKAAVLLITPIAFSIAEATGGNPRVLALFLLPTPTNRLSSFF